MTTSPDTDTSTALRDLDTRLAGATAQPRLASSASILDLVAAEVADAGLAGEARAVRLLYLIVVSRLLDRPCSVAVKGPSAGGKSYLVGQVLELFPPDAFHAITAMSDHALLYDDAPLVHRMLVVYEAAGIQSDTASYLVRSLLSEGRIDYQTVVRGKKGWEPKRISRDGPTGLITTTTAVSLHPENETRLLSITINDTPEQTRAVLLAHARGTRTNRDRTEWHALQSWLADSPVDVVIPFAEPLARAIPPVAIRLRRDFPTLLTLVAAHALLHQASRGRDEQDAVVASLADYAVVRDLVADLMADSAERTVGLITRETVAAVGGLAEQDLLLEGVTQTQVASALAVDKSTAQRRTQVAIKRGFLRNLETGRGRPARLILGDALPDDASFLPTVDELERLHGPTENREDNDPLDADYPWDDTGSDRDEDDLEGARKLATPIGDTS